MPNRALNFEALQQLTGYKRAADVERCLNGQGVQVLRGKDGQPFTTADALNQAMGISLGGKPKQTAIEFDFKEAG